MRTLVICAALLAGSPASAQDFVVEDFEVGVTVPAGATLELVTLTMDDTDGVPFGDTFFILYDNRGTLLPVPCGVDYRREAVGTSTRHVFRMDLGLFRLGDNRVAVSANAVGGTPVIDPSTSILVGTLNLPTRRHGYTQLGYSATVEVPGVSPFAAHCPATFCKDHDGDGLLDLWEEIFSEIARPNYRLELDEGLLTHADHHAVTITRITPLRRPSPAGTELLIAYVGNLAWSYDYGCGTFSDEHNGDNSWYTMLWHATPGTRRVDLVELITAGHVDGDPGTRSTSFPGDWFFDGDDGGLTLWFEAGKHGNWFDPDICESTASTGGCFPAELDCPDHGAYAAYDPAAVHAGEPTRQFVDSMDFHPLLSSLFPDEHVWAPTDRVDPSEFCGGLGEGDCSKTPGLHLITEFDHLGGLPHSLTVLNTIGGGVSCGLAPLGRYGCRRGFSGDPMAAGDADGDASEDSCDSCPGLPDWSPSSGDTDGDGLCDEMDPCSGVAHEAPVNCNADAEALASAATTLDACDPTPCGSTSIDTLTTTITGGGGATYRTEPAITIDARSSSPQAARAGLRFCWCTAATGRDVDVQRSACENPQADLSGSCPRGPGAYEQYDRLEGVTRWWRTSWTAVGFDPTDTTARFSTIDPNEVVIEHDAVSLGWGVGRDVTAVWDVETDVTRWDALVPASLATIHPNAIPGVDWTHAPGSDEATEFAPTLRDLTSHYGSGSVPRASEEFLRGARTPFPVMPVVRWFRDPVPCWACDRAFPPAWLVWERKEPHQIVLMLGDGVRASSGYFAAQSEQIIMNAPDAQWVAANEPDELLDEDGLRYIAVSADANSLPAMYVSAGTLSGSTPAPINQGPGKRSEFGVAASAQRAALWVVGGLDLQTGAPLEDLWRYDVFAGAWQAVPIQGVPPRRVAAAQWNAHDEHLYLIDRAAANVATVRLLRIDPRSGDSTELRSCNRESDAALSIAFDADGRMYTTSSRLGMHRVQAFKLPAATTPLFWETGNGDLATTTTRADRRGVGIVVGQPGDELRSIGYRRDRISQGQAPSCF